VLCHACFSSCKGHICPRCIAELRPAPERILDDGVRLVAAFEHVGAARELVHGLKYRGLTAYADLVVEVLGPRVPRLPIVPVPRAWTRQVLYGIDPAREIGLRLARFLDVPLWDVLSAPMHSRRRAGGDHSRPALKFSARTSVPSPVVLLDDVVTTGATVRSARKTLGCDRLALVVAANAADRCLVRKS
jgi:predicted amidophosphoribosyltransferase